MKPALLKIPSEPEHSFTVQEFCVPYFLTQWHCHQELELTLICEGSGKRLVGDSIENFEAGELVLLGANLPHLWRSDDSYHQNHPDLRSRSVVIHFQADFLGEAYLQKPEFRSIRELFEVSKFGIKVEGPALRLISRGMIALLELKGIYRLTKFLEILHAVSEVKNIKKLSSVGFSKDYSHTDAFRINKVYEYALSNFTGCISLKEISDVVHMSPKSFCRYFKSRTRKTFSQFLQEIRIGHSCKLLIEDRLSVSQICYETGFLNLSNFNRQFKALMRMTPVQYRKKYILDQDGAHATPMKIAR